MTSLPPHSATDAVLGVDIGGSGMKARLIDVTAGEILTDRVRIPTPATGSPDDMSGVFAELVSAFDWTGPVGCTFPGVIRQRSVVTTAANLDPAWIGVDARQHFGQAAPDAGPIVMVNDADAAGVAEARFGAARDVDGVVLLLTLGTGIGSALLVDGELVPNTELGHLELDGHVAEHQAASRVMDQGLSFEEWVPRLDRYLNHVAFLFSPDLIVLGGGISKRFEDFAPELTVKSAVVPASLRNDAGIVGAAFLAAAPTTA